MKRITNEQREAIVREAVAKRDGIIAGAPLASYPPEDQAFYKFWYGHMLNDLMQPPLANVDHATARYIWNAARGVGAAVMLSS